MLFDLWVTLGNGSTPGPAFTTYTLIERSATGGGVGFVQVGSVAAGTFSFTDTPPSSGTTYYYRLRNTDGFNYSVYTLEYAVGSLVPPPAVTNLAVKAPIGVPVLTWTAATTATSYNVQRGPVSGGETTVYSFNVSGGQACRYADTAAPAGVVTYYAVAGVNGCGQGATSNEVSVIPGTTTSPYLGGIV